jgi:hypothetical protein
MINLVIDKLIKNSSLNNMLDTSMWVCAGSLSRKLNFNVPGLVGLACENPGRIRE